MLIAIAALIVGIYTVSTLRIQLSQAERGDINHDGVVDALDLSMLLSDWQKNESVADLNHDGVVNDDDATILMGHWTK